MGANLSDMYGRVEGMVAADEAILRLLAPPKPLELHAGEIAHNTQFSDTYIQKRLRVLIEVGLVERADEDEPGYTHYRTTELGNDASDGKLSIQEMQSMFDEVRD